MLLPSVYGAPYAAWENGARRLKLCRRVPPAPDNRQVAAVGNAPHVSVSMVGIISGNLGELIGPGVDDWMAIDVVDASHDAFLEFVF